MNGKVILMPISQENLPNYVGKYVYMKGTQALIRGSDPRCAHYCFEGREQETNQWYYTRNERDPTPFYVAVAYIPGDKDSEFFLYKGRLQPAKSSNGVYFTYPYQLEVFRIIPWYSIRLDEIEEIPWEKELDYV